VEEVPRRPDVPHLAREVDRQRRHQGAAHQFKRLQPNVGRRPRVLPLEPQWTGDALLLRHHEQERPRSGSQSWAGSEIGLAWTWRDRLRAGWRPFAVRLEIWNHDAGGHSSAWRLSRDAHEVRERVQAAGFPRDLADWRPRGVYGTRRGADGSGRE